MKPLHLTLRDRRRFEAPSRPALWQAHGTGGGRIATKGAGERRLQAPWARPFEGPSAPPVASLAPYFAHGGLAA